MTHLTEINFSTETEGSSLPVLVGFYAAGSLQEQSLRELEQEHPNRIKFCSVDIERERSLARSFQILSAPTMVLLQEGEILQRIRGERSKDALAKILDLN